MAKSELKALLIEDKILTRIYLVRGCRVMLDEDLARMYKVETGRLNEQVKRNKNRFPKDFMFVLTTKEYENLKSQMRYQVGVEEEPSLVYLQSRE